MPCSVRPLRLSPGQQISTTRRYLTRLKVLVSKPYRRPKTNPTLPVSGFWDPVGYTRDGSVETFKRRRETEIKHGRVAMYVARSDLEQSWVKLGKSRLSEPGGAYA